MSWNIEETKDDWRTDLTVKQDEVDKARFEVTLYGNGPCIKSIIIPDDTVANEIMLEVTEYLMDHYGFPYGLSGYSYAYNRPDEKLYENAGFSFVRHLDGDRKMFHLDPPPLN